MDFTFPSPSFLPFHNSSGSIGSIGNGSALDCDFYSDRAISSFSSSNQGSEAAYMQEITSLRRTCLDLKLELSKTISERNTLQAAFDKLSTSLRSSPDTPEFTDKRAKYPKVRFWTQTSYTAWTRSPEGQADPNWKFACFEDHLGKAVDGDTVSAIRLKLKGAWKDLVYQKIAPKSWGKASASAKELVYDIVYKKCPFLALGDNDWKIDYICGLDYPGWVRRYLDKDGNYVEDRKQSVKHEDFTEAENPSTSTSENGKRKAYQQTAKSEVPKKKIKVSDEKDLPRLGQPEETVTTPPGAPMDNPIRTPQSDSFEITDNLLSPISSEPAIPSTDNTREPAAPSVNNTQEPTTPQSANSNLKPSTTNELEHSPHLTTSDTPEAPSISELDKLEVPMNPLATLTIKLKLPPLPPVPTPVPGDVKTTKKKIKAAASVAEKDKSSGSRKMRPSKYKTAFNLCAFRWLHQVNQTGTRDEFRAYWDALEDTQQKAYEKEVPDLVAKNGWDKTAFEGGAVY